MLTAGIAADTASTVVTDGVLLMRVIADNENTTVGDAAMLRAGRATTALALIYERQPGTKGISLLVGQGISIKQITASATGSVSYVIEFTDEVP